METLVVGGKGSAVPINLKPRNEESLELGDTIACCLIFFMKEIAEAVCCGLVDNHCERLVEDT